MSLSLPYFRNRRYLTGIDWIIGGLHSSARKSTGVGSFSQAILDVNGRLDESIIRQLLDQISARLPIIHGRVARDWMNIAPYWKIPGTGTTKPIPLRIVDLPSGSDCDAEQVLADHVNAPFESESQHLRVMLVRIGSEQSRLGLVFDHRLLDATGAEAFLRLIDETWQGRLEPIAAVMKQTEPAHLDHWLRRFSSGRRLNKLLYKLNEQDVCGLAIPPRTAAARVKFVHESLTPEETAAFSVRAGEEIGMPIILPSSTARATLAMRKVFPETPLSGTQYMLSTSANARPTGQIWESFFFNQFSFLMFSVPKDAPDSTPAVAAMMRDQFFEQMRENIPAAMADAAVLWRIFPPWLVAKLTRFLFKGRMCSLYFACLRESGFTGETFLGLPATNIIHTPLAFSPPGLNLCMTYFGGRFNLVLSYLEGAMTDDEARRMMAAFKSSLIS
ncbi:hypothetical protein BH10PLA1_BH10PLA1_09200 [soil metagenome]